MELNWKSAAESYKPLNPWNLNNTFLDNTCVTGEVSRGIWKYFKLSENENSVYQNLWDMAKAAVQGKCVALKASTGREV